MWLFDALRLGCSELGKFEEGLAERGDEFVEFVVKFVEAADFGKVVEAFDCFAEHFVVLCACVCVCVCMSKRE